LALISFLFRLLFLFTHWSTCVHRSICLWLVEETTFVGGFEHLVMLLHHSLLIRIKVFNLSDSIELLLFWWIRNMLIRNTRLRPRWLSWFIWHVTTPSTWSPTWPLSTLWSLWYFPIRFSWSSSNFFILIFKLNFGRSLILLWMKIWFCLKLSAVKILI